MTFSITARCEITGQLGIAISTKLPAVGSLCTYAKSGIGAITSQSFINPYIGINGLKYLKAGFSASEALDRVLREDPKYNLRQVSIVDNNGESVAFTGENCDTVKGHMMDDNFSVAGNMLISEKTLKDMNCFFKNNKNYSFPEQLLGALEAGQKAGGDKRGKQSAALYIVDKEEYPLIDIRVDDHFQPVIELRRLYLIWKRKMKPFVEMLPSLENPGGDIDFVKTRNLGILHDSD